jgi:putative membrane protein
MTESEPLAPLDPAEKAHRLHCSSLLFRLFPLLKAFLVPALLVFFVSSSGRWQLWLPLAILPALLVEWYRLRTLRYRLTEEELVITTGRWFRGERHIPYTRIQNIDLVQGPLHRLLDVGEVRLETASGSGAEATLVVLSRSAERDLRDAVARGRYAAGIAGSKQGLGAAARSAAEAGLDPTQLDATAEPLGEPMPVPPAPPIVALNFAELARIAVDPGRSLIPLGVLFGLAWEFDLFDRFDLRQRIGDWVDAGGFGYGWLDGLLVAVAVFLALTLFSLIGTTLMFHAFELRLVDDQFRIRRGLLTKVRATVPRRRIQLVSVHESLIHRWMGRIRVRVGTAGKGGFEDEDKQEESWLAPLVPKAELAGLLRKIEPRLAAEEPQWRAFPRAALHRARRQAVRIGVLLAVALVLVWRFTDELPDASLWLAPLPLIVLWWRAGFSHRHRAFALDGPRLALRDGWLTRRTSFLLMEKVQSVDVYHGFFDRRWRQASLYVDTAGGGSTGHDFELRRLAFDLAEALQTEIVQRAEQARFRWT